MLYHSVPCKNKPDNSEKNNKPLQSQTVFLSVLLSNWLQP